MVTVDALPAPRLEADDGGERSARLRQERIRAAGERAATARRVALARATVEARLAREAREAQAARVAREARLAREARATRAAAARRARQASQAAAERGSRAAPRQVPQATGRWVRPVAGRMVSGYGPRSGGWHDGVDIGAPFGTSIFAVGDGVVVESGPASGFGNWIVIRHTGGDFTVYGHQRTNLVRSGERVRAGQLIALVGSEGQSTGPHLHFEVRRRSVNGPTTDPLAWLRARGVTI